MLFSMEMVDQMSGQYAVNREDILLIALNACGVRSKYPYPRMRFRFAPDTRKDDPVYLILAAGREGSPFELTESEILFDDIGFGEVEELDNDDVVLGYFRKGNRVLTLNSNARSQCTGCTFCPNTIESAADPRLKAVEDLGDFLGFLIADMDWNDLSQVENHGNDPILVETAQAPIVTF